jgi:hypothetical protein
LLQAHLGNKVLVAQVVLNLLAKFVVGAEGVGKSKVGDDDVAIAVEEQVLQLQVAVDNSLLMQIADTRHELCKQTTSRVVLKVAVVENVVEQLSARCVLEDDADVSLCLDHLVQAHNVGMLQTTQNRDFTVDLGKAVGVVTQCLATDQLDGNLDSTFLLPSHLDLAKLSLSQSLSQDVLSELGLLSRVT